MPIRTVPDLMRPPEPGLDALEAAENGAVAVAEAYLPMLARIAEAGMQMIEAMSKTVAEDAELALAGAEAFAKVSQAVRRTVALHVKLAREAAGDRGRALGEQARRRAESAEAYQAAKDDAIFQTACDAFFSTVADDATDTREVIDRLFALDGESLADTDEFRDYLERPVGETVARLCAAVGIDPHACVQVDGVWKVRCPPSPFEKAIHPPIPPLPTLPPLHGEGGFERSEKTGGEWRSANDSG